MDNAKFNMKFIDEAIIEVSAGHGGKGCVSFRREKYVPRGGPDGGNGGHGGNVVFEATHNMSTLMDFRYKKAVDAPNGQAGMGSQCDGRAGDDAVVPVPVGTVVYDNTTNEVLFDFVKTGQKEILAKGGRGGKGNAFFVTSTRQTPRFSQEGEQGETKIIRLELKLLADVGLIGCPNAGKSTFLSVVSHARPKIADYPFTTVEPQLGVVSYQGVESFVIADLPGLIEGAHEGKGMGDRFLKHAERTKVLLHLVSLSPEEQTSTAERYSMIKDEVLKYDGLGKESSSDKKEIVLLTMADLMDEKMLKEQISEFETEIGIKPIVMSSAIGKNVDLVLGEVVKVLKAEGISSEVDDQEH